MAQNISQFTATGSYSDSTTANITTAVTWSVSDTSIATVGAHTGLLYMTNAGRIWGGTIGLTASLSPGTPGTASVVVVASDSGSVAPRMPQSDDQWVALGLSPWGSYWGMQEPTGSLVSSGSVSLTLTNTIAAGGGVTNYQQQIPGMMRLGIVLSGTNAGASPQLRASATPNIALTSSAFLTYAVVPPGAPGLGIVGTISNGAASVLNAVTDSSNAGFSGLSAKFGARSLELICPTTINHGDRVHPILVVSNVTTGDVLIASDIGVITSASAVFTAPGVCGLGAWPTSVGGAASASFCYFAMATGSIVEPLASTSGAADFLSRLGWNVKWKDCPVDSGSIRLPFLTSHWRQLGLSPWTATWNLQEMKGNFNSFNQWGPIDTGWSLTTIVDSFGNQVSGWNRAGSMVHTSGRRASVVTNYGPPLLFDPTGSFATLVYVAPLPTTLNSQGVLSGMGPPSVNSPSSTCVSLVRNDGIPILYCAGASATGAQNVVDGNVHPVLLVQDVTNGRTKLYTDLESITGSFNALSIVTSVTASMGFGGITNIASAFPCSGTYMYMSFCTGTLAESFSTDGVASAFLKSLGWTIPW